MNSANCQGQTVWLTGKGSSALLCRFESGSGAWPTGPKSRKEGRFLWMERRNLPTGFLVGRCFTPTNSLNGMPGRCQTAGKGLYGLGLHNGRFESVPWRDQGGPDQGQEWDCRLAHVNRQLSRDQEWPTKVWLSRRAQRSQSEAQRIGTYVLCFEPTKPAVRMPAAVFGRHLKKTALWAERYLFALTDRQVFSAGFPVVNAVVNSCCQH